MTTESIAASTRAQATISPTRSSWGAVRSEAKRLNRKSFSLVGMGLLLFFSLMATVITFLAAEERGPGFGTTIDLSSAQGLVAGLATAANLVGIVVLALWAAATASDYATGWIRVLVQAEPRRWRLFVAKLVALAGYTAVGTLAATVVSVAAAPGLAAAAGVSTAAWSTGAAATVVGAWFNLTIAAFAWGAIGVAIATVSRSATVAIAGGAGYLLVFEALLGLLAADLTTYFPGSVISAVAAGGSVSVAYATALVLAGGYAAVALVVAGVVFLRRDITS